MTLGDRSNRLRGRHDLPILRAVDRRPIRRAGRHCRLSRDAGACRKSACRRWSGARSFAIVGAMFIGGTAFVAWPSWPTPPVYRASGAVAPAQPRSHGRDTPAVKQRRSVVVGFKRIGRRPMVGSTERSSGAASERADQFGALRPAGQSSVKAVVIVVRRSGLAARPPFSTPRFLSLRSNSPTSCAGNRRPPRLLPRMLFSARDAPGLS